MLLLLLLVHNHQYMLVLRTNNQEDLEDCPLLQLQFTSSPNYSSLNAQKAQQVSKVNAGSQ